MLFPTNIVEMNCWGLLKKIVSMDALKFFCFFSKANLNLFDETNAISIPEKKAENSRAAKIYVTVVNALML